MIELFEHTFFEVNCIDFMNKEGPKARPLPVGGKRQKNILIYASSDFCFPFHTILKESTMKPCFECGELTTGRHHVVPRSKGGTKTVPLCLSCHRKVHEKEITHIELLRSGMEKARASGVKFGRPTRITDTMRNMVEDLYDKGYTIRKISSVIHLSLGSIHKILKEARDRGSEELG